MENKKLFYKKGGKAHVGKELDSDESSSDSFDKNTTNIVINKDILFPNAHHKCLMAKEGKMKVQSTDTLKYTTSDDVG